MRLVGLYRGGVALAVLALPGAASALPLVTTAPVSQSAPLISLPMFLLLSALLLLAGVTTLGRRTRAAVTVATLLVVAMALVGVTYASIFVVTISGDECNTETTKEIGYPGHLQDLCANPIRIVNVDCGNDLILNVPKRNDLGACQIGMILHNNDTCDFPDCGG